MHAGKIASEENTYSIDSSTTKGKIISITKNPNLVLFPMRMRMLLCQRAYLNVRNSVQGKWTSMFFKYNKPIFPRSYYAYYILIEYETNINIRVIEEGIEILQSHGRQFTRYKC